jgi:hypothetical protein
LITAATTFSAVFPQAVLLKFKRPGWYLNFGALIMKKALFKKERITLSNGCHFVENKTEVM